MTGGKKRGSFTVEAIFIVPLCLMVIFALLECGLYLHHQSWYREAAWECILVGMGDGETEAKMLAHWRGMEGRQAFPIRSVSVSTSAGNQKLGMSVQGGVSGLWGLFGMDFMIQVQREQIKPAHFIRQVQQLGKLREEVHES